MAWHTVCLVLCFHRLLVCVAPSRSLCGACFVMFLLLESPSNSTRCVLTLWPRRCHFTLMHSTVRGWHCAAGRAAAEPGAGCWPTRTPCTSEISLVAREHPFKSISAHPQLFVTLACRDWLVSGRLRAQLLSQSTGTPVQSMDGQSR